MEVRKKRWLNFAIFVLVMFLFVLLWLDFGAKEAVSSKSIRVGISVYDSEDIFIGQICKKITDELDWMGQENGVRIVYDIMGADISQSEQNQQISYMLSQDYDVICVNLVKRAQAANIIEMAKKADVPVIFFNRKPEDHDMNTWEQTYYIGGDSVQTGRLQAQILIHELKKKDNGIDHNHDGMLQYILFEGEPFHADTIYRTETVLQKLKEQTDIQQLAAVPANWSRALAKQKMKEFLQKFGSRTEVVICNNDDMALGVLDAYQESRYAGQRPQILGINGEVEAIRQVRAGRLLGTVQLNAQRQGEAIAGLIKQLMLEGRAKKQQKLEQRVYLTQQEMIFNP